MPKIYKIGLLTRVGWIKKAKQVLSFENQILCDR